MYSRIRSSICKGIEGKEIFVETDISNGLPSISIVGLASTTVMEAKDRIKSAIINSGFEYPRNRITINLMPADLKKDSSCLDLPMAVGILASNGIVNIRIDDSWALIGELALDGHISPVRGALPMLMQLKESNVGRIIVPAGNSEEAAMSGAKNIYPVGNLRECIEVLANPGDEKKLRTHTHREDATNELNHYDIDFSEIGGQESAKRAILVATAGRHGLLMVGSPGCGKTMLAARIPSVMLPMNEGELLETAVIRSIKGISNISSPTRPFRHPHHTIGRAGFLGGGSHIAEPGEITLAHNGVLFLDEICEFDRENIDGLRIPLEEKQITHFRKGETYVFPCDFQLVMASNPCPCGYYGDKEKECTCRQADIERYQNKLSGPIMDRIDMKITMERVSYGQLTGGVSGLSSLEMREAIEKGRAFALKMGREVYNADLTAQDMKKHCRLGEGEKAFISEAYESLGMSPRAYVRALKVARTIADLDESPEITQVHLAEALSYRMA